MCGDIARKTVAKQIYQNSIWKWFQSELKKKEALITDISNEDDGSLRAPISEGRIDPNALMKANSTFCYR